jgi:hypothetical protein
MTYEFNLYPRGTEAVAGSPSRISVCTVDGNRRHSWNAGAWDFSHSLWLLWVATAITFTDIRVNRFTRRLTREATAPGICRGSRSMAPLSKGSVQPLFKFVVSLSKVQLFVLVDWWCATLWLWYVYVLAALTPFMWFLSWEKKTLS